MTGHAAARMGGHVYHGAARKGGMYMTGPEETHVYDGACCWGAGRWPAKRAHVYDEATTVDYHCHHHYHRCYQLFKTVNKRLLLLTAHSGPGL